MQRASLVLAALERDDLALALLRCSDRRILEMNAVLARLSGHTDATLLNRSLACLAGAATDLAAQAAVESAIAKGTELHSEICWSRADGSAFWFGFTIVPVGEIGRLGAAVVLMGRDITERRRASRQETMTQAVLASVFRLLDIPAAVIRPDDRVLVANPAFAELTGYSLRELDGLHVDQLVGESSLQEARRRRAAQRQLGEPYRVSLVVLRKDGVEVPVRLTSAVVEHEGVVGFRVVTLLPAGRPVSDIRMPRESVVGRVRLVRLEPLQEAYGPRWAEVAPRLMMLCESVIKRRVDRDDVYARTEDGSFAIWFARGSEAENAERIAAITREIRISLAGEFEGDTAPDVTGLAATVPSHDLSRPPGPEELAATLMDRLEARRSALRAQVLAGLREALAAPTLVRERLVAVGGSGAGLVWVDLAPALRRRIEGARAIADTSDDALPDQEFVLLGAVAEQALSTLAGGDRSLHVFAIPFSALAVTSRRRGFVASCRALPPPVRELMLPVLDGIPPGIHPQRLLDLGQELAPLVASLGLAAEASALPPLPPGLGPFSLVVFEAHSLKPLPEGKLTRLFGEARARRLRVAVRHAGPDGTHLARLGAQFLGSPAD